MQVRDTCMVYDTEGGRDLRRRTRPCVGVGVAVFGSTGICMKDEGLDVRRD